MLLSQRIMTFILFGVFIKDIRFLNFNRFLKFFFLRSRRRILIGKCYISLFLLYKFVHRLLRKSCKQREVRYCTDLMRFCTLALRNHYYFTSNTIGRRVSLIIIIHHGNSTIWEVHSRSEL